MSARVVAVVLAGALAGSSVLAACGASPGAPTSTAPVPAWERLDDPPLSPRTDPVVAWTGREVLVVGGNTGGVCPPGADCAFPTELVADGAAWDPATGAWRPIAPAPVPLLSGWACQPCTAVVGGRVVVDASTLDRERWLAYDPARDAWSELDPPGFEVDLRQHDPDRVWGLREDRVVSWDPVSGRVRTERTYDVSPRLDDAHVILTGAGPVVAGVRYGDAAPDEPTLGLVDLPDGEGWRRVTSGQIGWFVTEVAGQVVGPEPGGADGGEVDGWDRWYPAGGLLDPRTGDWRPLDVPEQAGSRWQLEAYGDDVVVTAGHHRDLAGGGGWVALGAPDSDLDSSLTEVWAGDRLFVWGGVDDAAGYERPGGPEAWTWTLPRD